MKFVLSYRMILAAWTICTEMWLTRNKNRFQTNYSFRNCPLTCEIYFHFNWNLCLWHEYNFLKFQRRMNVWHNMRCPIYANNISALNDTIKYMARTESYLFLCSIRIKSSCLSPFRMSRVNLRRKVCSCSITKSQLIAPVPRHRLRDQAPLTPPVVDDVRSLWRTCKEQQLKHPYQPQYRRLMELQRLDET